MKLSCVVITLNEEGNIEDCLKTLAWADEIVVLDSGSSDQTVALARKAASSVYTLPFVNFASQKNAAVETARGDWIFLVDADERVPKALADEIRMLVDCSDQDAVYAVKRESYFFGKRLRFGGTQSDFPVRLFPRLKAKFTQPVHEVVETALPTKRLRHSMIHLTTRNWSQYREKMKRYLPLEIEMLRNKNYPKNCYDLVIKPLGVFVFLYFLKLGILDGWAGLQFSIFSSYYAFLKYWKYYRSPSLKSLAIPQNLV